MKFKFDTIIVIAISIAAGSNLSALALELRPTSQHFINTQQTTLLAGGGTVKGGHSSGKSPSKKGKHQKGEARRDEDQNINPAFKAYKQNGGRLSKTAWKKRG
ncbi:MAG: hypothetical protein RLZZ135_134, partial [Cyanobacteriota bacterium]